jgi:hypothetical protein
MGLLDRILGRRPDPDLNGMPTIGGLGFDLGYEPDGVTFTAGIDEIERARTGAGASRLRIQLLVLEMLAEQGLAAPLTNGYRVPEDEIAALDGSDAELLGLPPLFTGTFKGGLTGATTSPRFRVRLEAVVDDHEVSVQRDGATVHVLDERYRLGPAALMALRAADAHAALPERQRGRIRNVQLLAELDAARRLAAGEFGDVADSSFHLDLAHLAEWNTVVPTKVGLTVEQTVDGSLELFPDLGTGTDPDVLRERLQQLDAFPPGEGGVLHHDKTLVLLDPERRAGVEEIRRTPRIPAYQVPDFMRAYGDFLDPDLVPLDGGFGIRVMGIGLIAPVSFAQANETGIDWFAAVQSLLPPQSLATKAQTLPEHTALAATVEQAWQDGKALLTVDQDVVDIGDRSRVADALRASRERLEALGIPADDGGPAGGEGDPASSSGRTVTVGMHIADAADRAARLRTQADAARPVGPVDYESLRRAPFPHQREGIEWMTGLMHASLDAEYADVDRVQGALLADDMGLGKTFMTLVALREMLLAEWNRAGEARPVLAVMPVALLENWLAEIEETFSSSPFEDVVVLQGDGLKDFRRRGAGPETAVGEDDLDARGMVLPEVLQTRTALRIGATAGPARLDMPNRLVLTTYDTLRRYQISLGQVDWGVVVFDEAQATKNPDILVTRAAKGLKARFKLLATGTPVENSLRDFWCLMDTAQPGLLGTWAEFREQRAAPIEAASGEAKGQLGKDLRDAVGPFMLRRIKEDHLPDLPSKTIYRNNGVDMPPVQREAYDGALHRHRTLLRGTKGSALTTIQALAAVSLHPSAPGDTPMRSDDGGLLESARMIAAIAVLDRIRDLDEKVIVFASNKKVQQRLSIWLGERYGRFVPVVNGDTAAYVSDGSSQDTRRGIIKGFEAADGFNLIIMSPLAVGVGLTVVGANHAIHLERHWNPAKEAQATDRIYRIGQRRPVHVYLPMALHPDRDSFDVNLDRLLQNKTNLKDAVLVPDIVSEAEMVSALGLDLSADGSVAR